MADATAPHSAGLDPVALDALLDSSDAARRSGRYAEGAALAETAARQAAAAGDPRREALGLRLGALNRTRNGQPETAVQVADRAIDAFTALGDDWHRSELLTSQAYAYMLLGLTTEALDALSASRRIALELADTELLFWVYSRMGNVHNEMGDPEQGEGFLLQAYRRLGGLDLEAHFSINNNLALTAYYRAKQLLAAGRTAELDAVVDRGLGHAGTAVEIAEELGNPFLDGTALVNQAMLQALDGSTTLARQTLERSLAIAGDGGYASLAVSARQCIAEVLLMQGDLDAAVELMQQVLVLAGEGGEQTVELELLQLLSEAQERLGDYAAALAAFKQFHALDASIRSGVAGVRARLLAQDLELDGARQEAIQARRESEAERARTQALQADNAALQVRASELLETALRDPLTGLGNRRQLEDSLPHLFAAAHSSREVLCIAVIDIDEFKRINDTYGHAVGDQVLIRVAGLLSGSSRRGDLVGRLGGEEFLLAFPDLDLGAAASICERLRLNIESEDWTWLGASTTVTVSIGLQPMVGCDDVWQQVDRADRAMYRAKQAGRNRVSVGAAQ